MRRRDALVLDLARSRAAMMRRVPGASRGGLAPLSLLQAAILAAGLMASAVAAFAAWRTAETRDGQAFGHATEIELQAIRGQFAASDDVSLAALRAYVERVDIARRYAGFLAIGFTSAPPSGEAQALEGTMRAQGIADFAIHPAGPGPLVGPVMFAEPANARNRTALGFDVLTSPVRRELVERARDSGRSAATPRLQQEIDSNKQAGFLLGTSVYAGGAVPATVEARRLAFRGFIFGAFRADDLFVSIIATGAEDEAALAVYDGEPGELALLHRPAPRASTADTDRFRRVARLEIGGRAWTAVFTSRTPRDSGSTERDAWPIGGGGEAGGHDVAPGRYVMQRVGDSGIGMMPETAARAFDPFFTTKPLGQGTGLGLSMIYGFARQSGGQARIRSALGVGTTVELLLPHFDGAMDATAPATAPAPPAAGSGETVLVVDDEATVRMLVAEALQEQGYRVLEAGDGASALLILRTGGERIDLLVTDVGMPGGMNGRQLAEAARRERAGLKVLFITGFAEEAVLSAGQTDAGTGVMIKPFAMEALTTRVRAMLGEAVA